MTKWESRLARGLHALNRPESLVRNVLRRFSLGSFDLRLHLDAFPRPAYAYSLYQAAWLAERLGLERISAIEFGVAAGDGLVEIEKLVHEIEAVTSVRFDVYGFDTGKGLPGLTDYRDLPYIWQRGQYEMDQELLRSKLERAELVIGDVKDTIDGFLANLSAPIGFISFDLDFYSSTVDAFSVFKAEHGKTLPRVICYFDDTIGDDAQLHCEYVGELLAINEFNAREADQKLCKVHGLAAKRPFDCDWSECIYVCHRFNHPQYETYIGGPNS